MCFFRVCLSVLVFFPVVCMKLATYICVASTCEHSPRAYAELWAVSCLILLVIFCQVLNFRVSIPFPVPGWTGPVPGERNGSARKLLLPDAAGLAAAAVPLSRGPRGRLPRGSALLQSRAVTHGWFKQRCGRLRSPLARFGPSGGAKGCGAPRSGWRRSAALAGAGRRDSCLGSCTANLASFACGQRWEGPHVIAYAHVFMHSVLLLVSQSV